MSEDAAVGAWRIVRAGSWSMGSLGDEAIVHVNIDGEVWLGPDVVIVWDDDGEGGWLTAPWTKATVGFSRHSEFIQPGSGDRTPQAPTFHTLDALPRGAHVNIWAAPHPGAHTP